MTLRRRRSHSEQFAEFERGLVVPRRHYLKKTMIQPRMGHTDREDRRFHHTAGEHHSAFTAEIAVFIGSRVTLQSDEQQQINRLRNSSQPDAL
ncbi:hypothetical protein TNCV_5131381 [Trichonephila clavipes]|nr:hypothetical protein TNCV_5131381 [Trichonephila clavipes]